MAGRPRRTRVYDCNYNLGEQYYKSALDNIDRKNQPAPKPTENLLSRPKFNVDDLLNEDFGTARKRADLSLAGIDDDSVYDSRGLRVARSSLANTRHAAEEEFDDEVQSSLNRIRASKKLSSSAFNSKESEIEDTINTVKRRARLDLGEKLLEAAGEDEAGEGIRRRALKMVSRASDDYVDPKSLTKWTALANSANDEVALSRSAASQRAQATKARLAELDADIQERSDKQTARENRSAQLRRFVQENVQESYVGSSSSSKAEKHVNF